MRFPRGTAVRKKFGGSKGVRGSRLMLYAGPRGWENIEYQELLASAEEDGRISEVVPVTASARWRSVHCALQLLLVRPSHFFYDPRWGAQSRFWGFLEGRLLWAILTMLQCVPISLLNNLPERGWRRKISLVNGRRGICLVLVSPEVGARFAPEIVDQVGPMPMPFSGSRLKNLKLNWRDYDNHSSESGIEISFVGSLYEPRASILKNAKEKLAEAGVELLISGRELQNSKIGPEQYFSLLSRSPHTFTTAEQALTGSEDSFPIHLVYRYIEALAAGTLLIAPAVEGAERYFTPGVHFLESPNLLHLSREVPSKLRDGELVRTIRNAGRERVEELVKSGFFWSRIDTELVARNRPGLFIDA